MKFTIHRGSLLQNGWAACQNLGGYAPYPLSQLTCRYSLMLSSCSLSCSCTHLDMCHTGEGFRTEALNVMKTFHMSQGVCTIVQVVDKPQHVLQGRV